MCSSFSKITHALHFDGLLMFCKLSASGLWEEGAGMVCCTGFMAGQARMLCPEPQKTQKLGLERVQVRVLPV